MLVPQVFNVAGAALGLLASSVAGHPGHDVTHEALERRSYLNSVDARSLAHCQEKLAASGLQKRLAARREAQVSHERSKRGLPARAVERRATGAHNETELGYTPVTDAETLFQSINSCVLTPDVTQGPYYVGGEYVRRNIVEDQEGLGVILDYQVIDVETCDPVPDTYLEIWHCNATGVYSGVAASGNGDSSDTANIDTTFLRGIQKTDMDGVAQFQSIFPGHYTSRATHIHVMVHTNATLYSNGTLGNDVYSSHTGQTFFDQALISQVEALEPYNTNTQELTLNADDSILAEEQATDGVDPYMEYTTLGDSLEDGLFLWLAFGVNTTSSSSVSPAVFYYADGGVENENSGAGGSGGGSGGGDAPGDGSAPSGVPTGQMPSGTPSA